MAKDKRGKHNDSEDSRGTKGDAAGTKPGHKRAGTTPGKQKTNVSGRGNGNPDPPKHGGRGGGNSN